MQGARLQNPDFSAQSYPVQPLCHNPSLPSASEASWYQAIFTECILPPSSGPTLYSAVTPAVTPVACEDVLDTDAYLQRNAPQPHIPPDQGPDLSYLHSTSRYKSDDDVWDTLLG